jgi:predicted ATP-dependent endonuclease of OLD family
MKINYIYIDGYKNLNKLELSFDESSTVNALIGNNGSGKSNVIEALTRVFTSVYNDSTVCFVYEIHYTIADNEIVLCNKEKPVFLKNGKSVKKSEKETFLPRSIFLYYCGETDRLQKLASDCQDKKFEKALKTDGEIVTRYVSSVGLKEFAAALLANAIYQNATYDKVCELINIYNIGGPVTFNLKRPSWSKSAPITEKSFWNAQGAVAMLLHAIKDVGELQITDKNTAKIIVKNIADLKLGAESAFDLFVRFELLIQAGILNSIDFKIVKEGVEITSNDLSEGEKQLAQFLCILEATKDYRALFLLDEFDSFLHPNWQRRFAEIIDGISITGQVLFTTHSPLTLGKVRKENIRILKDGKIYIPSVDTYNRDITEVLDEIMEVTKRPVEIEKAIKEFRNAAMHGKKDEAYRSIEELKVLLSDEDPYWITIEHMLARMERTK